MSVLLELKDLTKAYDTYAVVDHLNLTVNEGELRCLIGPNGAGKTTTMDLITGRQKLTGGKVIFDGREINGLKENQIVRRGIGRKFQVPAVFRDLTVRENLEVAFNRNPNPFVNMLMFFRRTDKQRFDEIVEMIGLGDRLGDKAGYLSHGETQWLEIGMVLTQNPRLLLMDEPTAGMTEQETHKTSEIFKRLKGAHTLVVVEHDMTFVREIAEIISVLHLGKLLAEGPMHQIENDPKVREVYLGAEGISDAA